jgi:hypothetical protein
MNQDIWFWIGHYDRPYEGMNITGVKGLTPATIATLKALGAVENGE